MAHKICRRQARFCDANGETKVPDAGLLPAQLDQYKRQQGCQRPANQRITQHTGHKDILFSKYSCRTVHSSPKNAGHQMRSLKTFTHSDDQGR